MYVYYWIIGLLMSLNSYLINFKHNNCFLEKHVMRNYKEKSIALFEFQNDMIHKMMSIDQQTFMLNVGAGQINVKLKQACLGLDIGNGKTLIALGRIKNILDSGFKIIRILIVVPRTVFIQWIHEMISFWGLDFTKKNVYIASKPFTTNQDYDHNYIELLISDVLSKKIIILKYEDYNYLLVTTLKKFNFNLEFVFVDESHQDVLLDCDKIAKFTWNISSTKFIKPEINISFKTDTCLSFVDDIQNSIELTRSLVNEQLYNIINLRGNFLNVHSLTEHIIYYKPSVIPRLTLYNLDNFKNTILFDTNSTNYILDRLNSDCLLKKKQLFKSKYDDFFNKLRLNSNFDIITRTIQENTVDFANNYEKSISQSNFEFVRSKHDHDFLSYFQKIAAMYVSWNIFFAQLNELDFLNESLLSQFKNLDLTHDTYRKRILTHYCTVCLDETTKNILMTCCKQPICKDCVLKILTDSNHYDYCPCPFCRQTFIPTFLGVFTTCKPLVKNLLKTFTETLDEIINKFTKILIVYSKDESDSTLDSLKNLVKIQYDDLNSHTSIQIDNKLSNFKQTNKKFILFISSNYSSTGFNFDFVDCIFDISLNQTDDKMVRHANQFSRLSRLTVYYLRELNHIPTINKNFFD
jgi:hypothetical protein